MKNLCGIGIAIVGLSLASSALAYSCIGTLDFISVSPTGVVTVSSQSSGLATFYPCSLSSTVNGVTPDICKGMLATLLTAKSTGAQVAWAFTDSIGCNRSSYNGGNWYWLSDSPSAWYYGPQIQ